MSKKWIICNECEYLDKCKAGKARLNGLDIDSKVYNEIGCFNHETYVLQTNPKQLKLL